jgi:hypothetical protein
MSGAPRARLWGNAAALALLAWLYGGDVVEGLRARSAEVAALSEPPQLAFASIVLLLAVAVAGVSVWGWRTGRGDDFRGYRLLPILAAVAIFVDLFVLSAERNPFTSYELAAAAVGHLEQRASQLATDGLVPVDRASLEAVLPELGRPPYLARGRPLPGWTLEVRTGCSGPVTGAQTLPAGTLTYCAAPDRKRAWITAVGLPWEVRTGPPGIVTTPRGMLLGIVEPSRAEDASPDPSGP